MARFYADRVAFSSTTTGTGNLASGSAINDSFVGPSETAMADGDNVYLLIQEGMDFEIVDTTYVSAGPHFTRDTVLVSKIGGTVGTSKMNLGGTQQVRLVSPAAVSSSLASWAAVTRAAGFDTFAGTPSSANLASLVTNETGSGALVFADSPALTTPNLGTPSALVLTNATGLTASGVAAATLVTASEGIASNDNDTTLPTSAAVKAYADSVGGGARGHLWGLTLSNNATDATNDIDIAVGTAASDASPFSAMTLASGLTKRLDAAWAVGSGNGGLDAGTIADTTYHIWLIMRPDTGVVDALFSTSASAPTMPANYTLKRRIGSIMRISAAIKTFWQTGDTFIWRTSVTERSDTADVARTLITITVPTGISVAPLFSGFISRLASTSATMTVQDARDSGNTSTGYTWYQENPGMSLTAFSKVYTNTSGQVYYFFDENTAGSSELYLSGYEDSRGRLA